MFLLLLNVLCRSKVHSQSGSMTQTWATGVSPGLSVPASSRRMRAGFVESLSIVSSGEMIPCG